MANTRCCVQPALTLERTPSGWIQRASFTHPDLHDELVEEIVPLSSPFSSVCARGSSAFTFLLLGDQNAGKSTFLHSFSHAGDATWLEIVSYLPIISASSSTRACARTARRRRWMSHPSSTRTSVRQ